MCISRHVLFYRFYYKAFIRDNLSTKVRDSVKRRSHTTIIHFKQVMNFSIAPSFHCYLLFTLSIGGHSGANKMLNSSKHPFLTDNSD